MILVKIRRTLKKCFGLSPRLVFAAKPVQMRVKRVIVRDTVRVRS